MTEVEKLNAGLEYDFWDDDVNALKANAMSLCAKLNRHDPKDEKGIADILLELFGSAGETPWVGPNFNCDNGKKHPCRQTLYRQLQCYNSRYQRGADRRSLHDRSKYADHDRRSSFDPDEKKTA